LEDTSLSAPAIVLTNCKNGNLPAAAAKMPIIDEEIFGPVIGVMPFNDESEAIAAANASPYSLSASVWSCSSKNAKKIAQCINAGSIMINDHLMSHGLAQTAWGGFGNSGIGKTHGEAGFREMYKSKVIVNDILPGAKREPWWQPYSQKMNDGLEALGNLLGESSFIKKIKSLPKVIRFFILSWKNF
jgi:succinate-semialdehyde dehydrogenase/glutarate-semialdehyde dehydrogenase